jgi:hypothetical protein
VPHLPHQVLDLLRDSVPQRLPVTRKHSSLSVIKEHPLGPFLPSDLKIPSLDPTPGPSRRWETQVPLLFQRVTVGLMQDKNHTVFFGWAAASPSWTFEGLKCKFPRKDDISLVLWAFGSSPCLPRSSPLTTARGSFRNHIFAGYGDACL